EIDTFPSGRGSDLLAKIGLSGIQGQVGAQLLGDRASEWIEIDTDGAEAEGAGADQRALSDDPQTDPGDVLPRRRLALADGVHANVEEVGEGRPFVRDPVRDA